jgi:hypothetical protein
MVGPVGFEWAPIVLDVEVIVLEVPVVLVVTVTVTHDCLYAPVTQFVIVPGEAVILTGIDTLTKEPPGIESAYENWPLPLYVQPVLGV